MVSACDGLLILRGGEPGEGCERREDRRMPEGEHGRAGSSGREPADGQRAGTVRGAELAPGERRHVLHQVGLGVPELAVHALGVHRQDAVGIGHDDDRGHAVVGLGEGIGRVVGVAVPRPVRRAPRLPRQQDQRGQRRGHLGEPDRWQVDVGRSGVEVGDLGWDGHGDHHALIGELAGGGNLRPDLLQLWDLDHVFGIEGHQASHRGERTRLHVDGVEGGQQGQHHRGHRHHPAPAAGAGPAGGRHPHGEDEGEAPDIGQPGEVRGHQRTEREHQRHHAGDHRGDRQATPQLALPSAGAPRHRRHQREESQAAKDEREPPGDDRDVHDGFPGPGTNPAMASTALRPVRASTTSSMPGAQPAVQAGGIGVHAVHHVELLAVLLGHALEIGGERVVAARRPRPRRCGRPPRPRPPTAAASRRLRRARRADRPGDRSGPGPIRSDAARRTGAGSGAPGPGRSRVAASRVAAHRRRAASPPPRRRRTARRSGCRAGRRGAWRGRASPPPPATGSDPPGSTRRPRAHGSAREASDRAGRRASREAARRPGRRSRPAWSGRPGAGLPSGGRRRWPRERPGPHRRPPRHGRGGCG